MEKASRVVDSPMPRRLTKVRRSAKSDSQYVQRALLVQSNYLLVLISRLGKDRCTLLRFRPAAAFACELEESKADREYSVKHLPACTSCRWDSKIQDNQDLCELSQTSMLRICLASIGAFALVKGEPMGEGGGCPAVRSKLSDLDPICLAVSPMEKRHGPKRGRAGRCHPYCLPIAVVMRLEG
jgi:hypothetical protein